MSPSAPCLLGPALWASQALAVLAPMVLRVILKSSGCSSSLTDAFLPLLPSFFS